MDKLKELKSIIRNKGKLTVAFSGGTDSALLLDVAREVLGERCLAVTLSLIGMPNEEKVLATKFCKDRGIRQIIIEIDELSIPGFMENPKDRCYLCKKSIFGNVINTAKEMDMLPVADGSNFDDTGDYRPGMRALSEMNVISPLLMARLTKEEIREISKNRGLPTWDIPSSPCLSSRIPYGEIITKRKLLMVGEAEKHIKSLGYEVCRVRTYETRNGEFSGANEREDLQNSCSSKANSNARYNQSAEIIAKVEVDKSKIDRIKRDLDNIKIKLKSLGYKDVILDAQGFKSGKLNSDIDVKMSQQIRIN